MSAPPGWSHSRAVSTDVLEVTRSAMVNDRFEGQVRQFCWVDLATVDAKAARSFYCRLFGWAVQDQRAGEGHFSTFEQREAPFASLYQLSRKQIEHGVPSHWTPYVSVPDVDATASKASGLGGQVIVPPQDFAGLARVSLISDPAGALIGLWQRPRETNSQYRHQGP
jgi:predicted enzyme related to lactoylglutathione lyase